MHTRMRQMVVIGAWLVFGCVALSSPPSVGYARGCALVPPWKYDVTVTFKAPSDVPLTMTEGVIRHSRSTYPTIDNPTKTPIYLIPSRTIASNATMEEMMAHPQTIKLVEHTTYGWDYTTKAWVALAKEPYTIDGAFFSTTAIPAQSSCTDEQRLDDPITAPPALHDHLTIVYDERVIKVPAVLDYVEHPNYQQEYDHYVAETTNTVSILKNTLTGFVSVVGLMIGLIIGCIAIIWSIRYAVRKKKQIRQH